MTFYYAFNIDEAITILISRKLICLLNVTKRQTNDITHVSDLSMPCHNMFKYFSDFLEFLELFEVLKLLNLILLDFKIHKFLISQILFLVYNTHVFNIINAVLPLCEFVRLFLIHLNDSIFKIIFFQQEFL